MLTMLEKVAGILDAPRKSLAMDVFQLDGKLIPQLREQILTRSRQAIPAHLTIKEIFIIGSITGFKYRETSDIDVNIKIDPYPEGLAKTALTKGVNGFLSYGGRHPINFFLQKYIEGANWAGSKFGVYDVLNNRWEQEPPAQSSIKDPKQEFVMEILQARQFGREFDRRAKEYYKDLKELEDIKLTTKGTPTRSALIKKKKAEIKADLINLVTFIDRIDTGRKETYRTGWGTPRRSAQNIIFKYIEHGPHGELFEKLEPLKAEDVTV
jgi:predicted nucleotidyltransferase